MVDCNNIVLIALELVPIALPSFVLEEFVDIEIRWFETLVCMYVAGYGYKFSALNQTPTIQIENYGTQVEWFCNAEMKPWAIAVPGSFLGLFCWYWETWIWKRIVVIEYLNGDVRRYTKSVWWCNWAILQQLLLFSFRSFSGGSLSKKSRFVSIMSGHQQSAGN